MADMVGASATVLDDLPESIVVDDILVRLSPKDVLRCRAVRRSWCRATSAPRFIRDHHRRQPSLPVLEILARDGERGHRLAVYQDDAGAGASSQKLRPFLRHSDSLGLHASSDGLLVVSEENAFYICNPATRKCARLPHPLARLGFGTRKCARLPHPLVRLGFGTRVVGIYRHHPSDEYRVLWVSVDHHNNGRTDFFVLEVGSDEPNPRHIEWPTVSPSMEHAMLKGLPFYSVCSSVYHRGNLHWQLGRCFGATMDLLVFDTEAEVFRTMRRPDLLGPWARLFKIDSSTLALCSNTNDNDGGADSVTDQLTAHVWVVQDYEAETWTCRYRINLSAIKASLPLDLTAASFPMVAVVNERELLIKFSHRVLRCDNDGKYIGNVAISEDDDEIVYIVEHHFRESLIPITSRGIAEEDEVPPFFIGL